MAERTAGAWADALSCMNIRGGSDTDRTLFYTCLYHTLLDPRTATDTDGSFADRDGTVRQAGYTHRTMFSGWDVYRSEFPLLTLISPTTVRDTVRSLLHIAQNDRRSFPRWELMGTDSGCKVGDPGTIVMADAFLKGIRDFDVPAAWAIARASAQARNTLGGVPFHSIRPDSEAYLQRSYVPGDLSSTLEYLMADYTMYRMAEALGDESDAAYFRDRVMRYRENYDPASGFMAPRDENGTFLPVRDRYDTTGCVESNIFQQSMFVPWDVPGLADLFGRDRLIALLEELFAGADLTALWNENYNHSNEPCHNLTHYFAVLGLPTRTQYWTRRVQKEAYRPGAFGFCGNEDVGQLSAWYVLSAMGFAQICMGDDKYILNTPLFEQTTLKLSPADHACTVDDVFTVRCDRNPQDFPYIAAARLNGQVLDRPYVTYGEITAGGLLELSLKKDA
jgi:predicted alpha-1,2-mannosidase